MFCKPSLPLWKQWKPQSEQKSDSQTSEKERKRKKLGCKKKIIPIEKKTEVLSTRNSENWKH